MDWVTSILLPFFFNKIDVVQNVSCHFEPTRSISVGCGEGNFSFPEENLFTKAALCEIALTAT